MKQRVSLLHPVAKRNILREQKHNHNYPAIGVCENLSVLQMSASILNREDFEYRNE